MAAWADRYVQYLTLLGVPFVIRPGWGRQSADRGDWATGQPIGTIDHHFVNPYTSPDGLSMIEGGYSGGPSPFIVNQYLEHIRGRAARLCLVSQYPTGHPGRGSRAVADRVRRGLPILGDAAAQGYSNDLPQSEAERLYYGTEVQNPGDGTPLTDEQNSILDRADAAFCLATGLPASAVIQHREHTDRKSDIHPRAMDAHAHRRRVQAIVDRVRSSRSAADWVAFFAAAMA